jgi:hypothetical protein
MSFLSEIWEYDFREQYPALLKKVNRGKFHNLSSVPNRFGELKANTAVAGVELLDAYEKGELILTEDG